MTLAEYIKQVPRNERNALRQRIAAVLGVSEVYVRSMCNGNKNIPGIYAIPIEKVTNGAVSRHITAPVLYPLE